MSDRDLYEAIQEELLVFHQLIKVHVVFPEVLFIESAVLMKVFTFELFGVSDILLFILNFL